MIGQRQITIIQVISENFKQGNNKDERCIAYFIWS